MCEPFVGLPDVDVVGVDDARDGSRSGIEVASRADQGWRRACGVKARIEDTTPASLVDTTCFGRPARLVWHSQRWWCAQAGCPAGSWTVHVEFGLIDVSSPLNCFNTVPVNGSKS